jgi:hypothetical protein
MRHWRVPLLQEAPRKREFRDSTGAMSERGYAAVASYALVGGIVARSCVEVTDKGLFDRRANPALWFNLHPATPLPEAHNLVAWL